ncbi:hypothetical protein ACFLSZ_00535 [Candidatus Bipolaricaulota bacterium]
MVRLDVELRDCRASVDNLLALYGSLASLPGGIQKLVAEIVMLRLFDILSEHLRRITCKVACGGMYLDGTAPSLLHRSTSMAGAEKAMRTHGRGSKLHNHLRWSASKYIKENSVFVIDRRDHLIVTLDSHHMLIDEMRRVRNRIAHNNQGSRKAYSQVIRRRYGAKVRGVRPGVLLLSTRWSPVPLEEYLRSTRVLVRALVKG